MIGRCKRKLVVLCHLSFGIKKGLEGLAHALNLRLRAEHLNGIPESRWTIRPRDLQPVRFEEAQGIGNQLPIARVEYIQFELLNIGALLQVLKCPDRKSTRLNSSHRCISYAVFCL